MTKNQKLEDIKNKVYAIHLPYTEEDEQVKQLIEEAYRLGLQDCWDDFHKDLD
jgi:hypothetical protein